VQFSAATNKAQGLYFRVSTIFKSLEFTAYVAQLIDRANVRVDDA